MVLVVGLMGIAWIGNGEFFQDKLQFKYSLNIDR